MTNFASTSAMRATTTIIPSLNGSPSKHIYAAEGFLDPSGQISYLTLSIDRPYYVETVQCFFDFERTLSCVLHSHVRLTALVPNGTIPIYLYSAQQYQGVTTTDGSALAVQPVPSVSTYVKEINTVFPKGTIFTFYLYVGPANTQTKWQRLQMRGYYI